MRQSARKLSRFIKIVVVNLLVFLLLLAIAEISYRVYKEDIPTAFMNLVNSSVPYSNIRTGNWVISDEVLGYRLNPNQKGINRISIRHGEIVTPKPEGLFRLMFLGDSVSYESLGSKPGFVSHIRDSLSKKGDFEVINASVPGYTTYQELMWFKRDLLQTSPDLVLLSYVLNDNHRFCIGSIQKLVC